MKDRDIVVIDGISYITVWSSDSGWLYFEID